MDLNELRGEINAIDEEILNLFLRRMDIASQVADYKKAHDLPIYQPQREREILETIEQKAGPVLGRYARNLFAKLMELSKDYQREVLK
jgi:chorismate mutase/prephenate dehydratase